MNKWLKNNGFNEDMITYIYFPADSYEKREELKDAGFRFDKNLLWHCAKIPSGYEDYCLSIELEEIGMLECGEGVYNDNVKDYVKAKLASRRPKEDKAESQHLFSIGEKVKDYPVRITFMKLIDSQFGLTLLIKMKDEKHNELTWWTSSAVKCEVGDKVLLSGTVKAHDEYNGVKSTVMTRCKLK